MRRIQQLGVSAGGRRPILPSFEAGTSWDGRGAGVSWDMEPGSCGGRGEVELLQDDRRAEVCPAHSMVGADAATGCGRTCSPKILGATAPLRVPRAATRSPAAPAPRVPMECRQWRMTGGGSSGGRLRWVNVEPEAVA